MKIFFIGAKMPVLYPKYEKIITALKKLGHQVDHEWMTTSVENEALHFEDAYKRNMSSIKKCDILVTETSEISSGVGYLTAVALNEKKPVLALYSNNSGAKEPATIKASSKESRILVFKKYEDSTIEAIINEFTRRVKNQLDTKFILIISPEIDRYLTWASEQRRMHKAQLVRKAVEDMMEKDKEYKAVLA